MAASVAVTVAFGTTAAEGSVTVPINAPVSDVCPINDEANMTKQMTTTAMPLHLPWSSFLDIPRSQSLFFAFRINGG